MLLALLGFGNWSLGISSDMIRFLQNCEEECHRLVEKCAPSCAPFMRRYSRVWRYLVSGGSAAVVDLGLLYGLTEWATLHYLFSAMLAFIAAFFISFFLQKFWTFQDHSVERVHAQAVLYFVIAVANLGLNTLLMYLFVEYLHLWYLAAQIMAGGAIACESFFISRHVVFKSRLKASSEKAPINEPSL